MKKILVILFLFLFLLPAVGENTLSSEKKYPIFFENWTDLIFYKSYINVFDKEYTCFNSSPCYNLKSYHYRKFPEAFYIDAIMDLAYCNYHQIYKSPYGDGYISHLIFETKLRNNKLTVKCKGFVVGDIIADAQDGYHYDIKAVYMTPPSTIKNLEEFEDFAIEEKSHYKIIELLVRNLVD